jgi:heme-degrading monooxygenase HmoA
VILEVAVLDVRPGQREAFEKAFAEAEPLIARARDHRGHELRRCVEDEHRFLLLVEWETLEDHTEGFRGSADYERWRALLHHFYDPFPMVQHYA